MAEYQVIIDATARSTRCLGLGPSASSLRSRRSAPGGLGTRIRQTGPEPAGQDAGQGTRARWVVSTPGRVPGFSGSASFGINSGAPHDVHGAGAVMAPSTIGGGKMLGLAQGPRAGLPDRPEHGAFADRPALLR